MLAQLSSPQPCDLAGTVLSEYNNLEPRWHDWGSVGAACARAATVVVDHRCNPIGATELHIPTRRTLTMEASEPGSSP